MTRRLRISVPLRRGHLTVLFADGERSREGQVPVAMIEGPAFLGHVHFAEVGQAELSGKLRKGCVRCARAR